MMLSWKSMRFLAVLVFCVTSNFLQAKETDSITNPGFIGSQQCRSCHESEYQEWKSSDHFWSMAKASDVTVKGNFNNIEFDYFGQSYRFFQRNDSYFVEITTGNKEQQRFKISYTFGHFPLQQYLVGHGESPLIL